MCNTRAGRCASLLSRMKLITVEPVLFLYMLIIFMEMNTLQSLLYTKVCLEELAPQNMSVCTNELKNSTVEHKAVTWNKYYSGCLNFFTLVVSFYVASWSDCFSRKVIMAIPPIGTALASIINTVLSFYLHAHVAFFFISAVISGVTFGTVGLIASTFGYLTEIVSEESRTKRIFILEMMIFVGGTAGYSLSGFILKHTDLDSFYNDYAKVFTLECIIAVMIVIYILFRIPYESTSEEMIVLRAQQDVTCTQLFSLKHIKQSFQAVFKRRSNNDRKKLLLLLLSYVVLSFGLSVQLVLSFLYVKNEPLNWKSEEYSIYSAAQFGVEGLGLLLGLPIAFHVLHVSDKVTAALGFLSRALGLILFGLSTTKTMVYSCCALFIFSEYASPSIRSMLSKIVEENERGKIFAVTTILQNFCYFVGSFLFSSIFKASLSTFPGLCFEIVAGLQIIGIIVMSYLYFTSVELLTVYEIMEDEEGNVQEKFYTTPVNKELQHPAA